MSHFRPYPVYRESGIDWVDPIPSHWSTKAIKRLVRSRVDRTTGLLEGTYIGLEDVQSGSGRYMPTENDSRRSEDSMAALFSEGDVLYGKLRPYLRKAFIPDFNGAASTEFLILTPLKGTQSTWLLNWLLTPELTQQIEAGCEGAKMPRADWEHVGGLKLPVPPIAEQQEICSTLAKETVRIDTLIEKKTRFIELLKEKRQALVTHAVTKGLNPNVPMKDSGIEWLGELPAHWTTPAFQHVVRITEGQVDPRIPPFISMPLYAPNHIEPGTGRLLGVETAEEQGAESGKYIVDAGDIIYSKIRPALRKVCIAPADGLCSADMYPMKTASDLLQRFLFWVLLSGPFSDYVAGESDRVAMPKVNRETLSGIRIPLPPLEEQMQIAAYVNDETKAIDKIFQLTLKSIQLLKERRFSLITAAVTGKIDLRDAA